MTEEPVAVVETSDDRPARSPGRTGTALVVAVVVVLVLGALAIWAAMARTDEESSAPARRSRVLTSPAAKAVLAALGASTGTGGYEVSYQFKIDRPSPKPGACPQGKAVRSVRASDDAVSSVAGDPCQPGRQVTVDGHGTVHLDPYLLETRSTVSGLGEVAVRTDGNLIIEQGGGNYGDVENGQPLSGFASLVEGTFGQGPGALTMLGLASPTGYLSLSADAVTGVTPAGDGTVDGVHLTYYDVVSDTSAMQRLVGLTAEQRKTITEALAVLERSGFQEATARIAVDDAGYIRESTSKATFSDGTVMLRHMTLSKFGCVGTGPTPADPDGSPAPADCVPPSTTTSSTTVSSTSTTLPPTSSTTDGSTATTAGPVVSSSTTLLTSSSSSGPPGG